jgi:hypothetical protein
MLGGAATGASILLFTVTINLLARSENLPRATFMSALVALPSSEAASQFSLISDWSCAATKGLIMFGVLAVVAAAMKWDLRKFQ